MTEVIVALTLIALAQAGVLALAVRQSQGGGDEGGGDNEVSGGGIEQAEDPDGARRRLGFR